MTKILGIDTGTNSLGWAIVERNEETNEYTLLDHGTHIFAEGVKIEKGIESSRASERTEHRGVRRHYWRRKVRKIRLLKVLIDNHLCPPLSDADLRRWRLNKHYPIDEAFMAWQRTEDKEGINPYRFRHICLSERLNLDDLTQRYILGRALYHINQRRGFLSNRKESTKESDGEVKKGIARLDEEMREAGCAYIGDYFYTLYERSERIRNHYTSRKEHYLAEFRAICAKQQLDTELTSRLEKAIFFQRPLKSQKQSVGVCTFEKGKARCPVSHPLYEEYRMWSFINNIKMQGPGDAALRPLKPEEINRIIPLFMRKSKSSFPMEDIAKTLGGKKNYCCIKEDSPKQFKFNYFMDTSVSGCPVTAQLIDIFGDDWKSVICQVYTAAGNKSEEQIVNDVWHALVFFDDDDRLRDFARTKLQLSDEDAAKFAAIKMPQDYAALSIKAIRKILPYLRDYGLIYSEAVFLANLCAVLPAGVWEDEKRRAHTIEGAIEAIHRPGDDTMEQRLKDYLRLSYDVDDEHLARIFHPSMLETYPDCKPDERGIYRLGSPRINSVKNPMAMHSMFRLRKVVNRLLAEGKIDNETVIHIEFARELNDANRRKAIKDFQRDNEKTREECRKKIAEVFKDLDIAREPSDNDILRYRLWEEQNHVCLYTGESISLSDFLGSNPKYDIEHSVPRSAGGDSTMMNLTLCQNRFNREVKKTALPSQLANIEEILPRIAHWKEKAEELGKQIRRLKSARPAAKEDKDRNIQRRHLLSLQRDYWLGKYRRFTMTEVPEGFSRRQGTDISVISRYARLYLKSVFKKVFVVKGIATSDFRKMWGIQEEYSRKERVNHAHHCIDAITIACIGPHEYARLAQYYHEEADNKFYGREKPQNFPKPWRTFVEDIRHIQDRLLVSHYTADNIAKSARRRIDTPDGRLLCRGDVARGSLHLDTCYGAIDRDGDIKYVVRRTLDSLDEKDIKLIVDDEVRARVEQSVKEYGSLKKAVEADGVWMNREKGVRIRKVRVFTPSVTRPVNIRHHRDVSRHEYKQQIHVMNDRNYAMAIYIGKDAKGKEKRDFKLVNMLDAANHYRRSNKRDANEPLVEPTSPKGYPLAYFLKPGTMVLLYENSPKEVLEASKEELQRRLYKVTGLSSMAFPNRSYGTLSLFHQQEARPSSEIKCINGAYQNGELLRPGIKLLHTQLNALVEGKDFVMNEIGEIVFK